jgi:catechol 2,3-dioxygenase-like lactoylglutathione lyase family enzyme
VPPTLSSRDLTETLAFYRRLGFEPEASPVAEDELILRLGNLELRFAHTPGLNPFLDGGTTYLQVPHPDQLHSEWELIGVELDRSTGSRLLGPIDSGDAAREFSLIDKSGNVVRFGSAPPE